MTGATSTPSQPERAKRRRIDHHADIKDLFDSLSPTLRERIRLQAPASRDATKPGAFVLYMPTVALRKRHNPSFAWACHLANHYQLPLLVYAVVLDDHFHAGTKSVPVVATARRVTFLLQGLQQASSDWQTHGAGVILHLHGPGNRTPHALSWMASGLAHAVVLDETFGISPMCHFAQQSIQGCRRHGIPCWTADSSITVPVGAVNTVKGPPAKAWIWEQSSRPRRQRHVLGIVRQGHADAPELQHRLRLDDFSSTSAPSWVPAAWRKAETLTPSGRPWTPSELAAIANLPDWILEHWGHACDTSVPPCQQPHGSEQAGQQRWTQFRDHHLQYYAQRRNRPTTPHAVSRMSCYLNWGIVSIFDIVADVWEVQAQKTSFSKGCAKFLDEVVKWREIGYVHGYCRQNGISGNPPRSFPTQHDIPPWARVFLDRQSKASGFSYTYEQLDRSETTDATWNAMQTYLVETGELHNNARMTWGKTVVHWLSRTASSPTGILETLCTLNDRYALDGLSPPSYAGILWCFGWCDKPAGGTSISIKWASHYRFGAEAFVEAQQALMASGMKSTQPSTGTPRTKVTKSANNSILAYFSPKETPHSKRLKETQDDRGVQLIG